jgi:hypothetical protein
MAAIMADNSNSENDKNYIQVYVDGAYICVN